MATKHSPPSVNENFRKTANATNKGPATTRQMRQTKRPADKILIPPTKPKARVLDFYHNAKDQVIEATNGLVNIIKNTDKDLLEEDSQYEPDSDELYIDSDDSEER